MHDDAYIFTFAEETDLVEVEATLHLALIAGEGLYGEALVRLEASHSLDISKRTIAIDSDSTVSAAVVRIFTSLLLREIGEDSFSIRRAARSSVRPSLTTCLSN